MKGWAKNDAKQFFHEKDDAKVYKAVDEAGQKMIAQGAEGRVWLSSYLGRPSVVKERLVKKYRIPAIDSKLNKTRLLHEARCIVRCEKEGISVPHVYMVDTEALKIHMERIEGTTIKALLKRDAAGNKDKDKDKAGKSASAVCSGYSSSFFKLAQEIGETIAAMHAADVTHGDLTTSNIIIRSPSSSQTSDSTYTSASAGIVLIDFGLGNSQTTAEDKAVDLYVLERAFIATHPGSEPLVACLMEAYTTAALREDPAEQVEADEEKMAVTETGTSAGVEVVEYEEDSVQAKRAAKRARKAENKAKAGGGKAAKRSMKGAEVLRRLEAVRQRGRKRDMFG